MHTEKKEHPKTSPWQPVLLYCTDAMGPEQHALYSPGGFLQSEGLQGVCPFSMGKAPAKATGLLGSDPAKLLA